MRKFASVIGILLTVVAYGAQADYLDDNLTPKALAKFSPAARADIVAYLVDNKQKFRDAGLSEPDRFLHFMAEIATETGGLVRIDEDLYYSEKGLLRTFPKRMKPPSVVSKLARNPRALANFVYGGRLGNDKKEDGWTYRGSGLIQLTGKSNFLSRGKEIAVFDEKGNRHPDEYLARNPDRVRELPLGFLTAVAYWQAKNVNTMIDKKASLEKVRMAVNGGLNGIDNCRFWMARAKRSFKLRGLESGADRAASKDELAALQGILKELGYLTTTGLESGSANKIKLSDAIKQFETDNELVANGIATSQLESAGRIESVETSIDEETLYRLLSPAFFRNDVWLDRLESR